MDVANGSSSSSNSSNSSNSSRLQKGGRLRITRQSIMSDCIIPGCSVIIIAGWSCTEGGNTHYVCTKVKKNVNLFLCFFLAK